MSHLNRLRGGLIALLLVCSFSAGAIGAAALPALASDVDYHTTCVGHGFVSGSDPNDGSAFSRVESGNCGSSAYRSCDIYNSSGTYLGGQSVSDNYTTCNAWSRDYGNFTECRLYAKVSYPVAFSSHNHTPTNYCP